MFDQDSDDNRGRSARQQILAVVDQANSLRPNRLMKLRGNRIVPVVLPGRRVKEPEVL